MSHLPASTLILTLAALTAATGCRIRERGETDPPGDEALSAAEQQIIADSTELDETTQDGAGLAAIPSLPLLFSDGPPTLAKAVELQQLGAKLFVPAGCATATAEGNVVTYTFDGCTGSYGLIALSGREIATFRPGAEVGSTAVELESEELTLGGRAIEHQAQVTVVFDDGGKRVDWTGTLRGTTRLGRAVEHTADLVLRIDDETRCSTLDGATTGSVGVRGLDVVYEGFEVCPPRGTCPAGRIEATGHVRQQTLGVEFDGSALAVVSTPGGAEVDLELGCTPRGGP